MKILNLDGLSEMQGGRHSIAKVESEWLQGEWSLVNEKGTLVRKSSLMSKMLSFRQVKL